MFSIIERKKTSLCQIFFLLFGVWAIITAFWSLQQDTSLLRGLYFLFLFIGTFRMGELLFESPFKRRFALLITITFLVIVILNLISLALDYPYYPLEGRHYSGFRGFTSHPNKLAQYILLLLPFTLISLYFLKEQYGKAQALKLGLSGKRANTLNSSVEKRWFKESKYYYLLFGIILCVLSYYLLVHTRSRAALGTLFLIAAFFIFFALSIRNVIKIIISISVVLLLLFSFSPEFSKSLNDFVFEGNSTNLFLNRQHLIDASYEAAIEGGVKGIGYGVSSPQFQSYKYGGYYVGSKYFQREKTISVLALIEEVGVVGLLLFFGGICSVLYANLRLLTKYKADKNFYVPLFSFSFLLSLCVYAQIESWWVRLDSAPLTLFFIFAGLIVGSVNSSNVVVQRKA